MTKQKRLALAAALLGTAAMVNPAFADVAVNASIQKNKDVRVNETITVTKNIEIDTGLIVIDVDIASEALALVNQRNSGNTVRRGNFTSDGYVRSFASITGTNGNSVSDNEGIVHVNQDSGVLVKQANAVATAWTDNSSGGGAFANSQASVAQHNIGNNVLLGPGGIANSINNTLRSRSTISDSINRNNGIVGVNQNSGNINDQANVVALAAGLVSDGSDGVLAVSEADLGQENVNHFLLEVGSIRETFIGGRNGGSINGNHGIVGVNQAAGNSTVQANVVSVSAVLR